MSLHLSISTFLVALLLLLTSASKSPPTGLCSVASDCVSGAICQDGHCACAGEDTLPMDGECLAIKRHGEECKRQAECSFSGKPSSQRPASCSLT